MNALTLTEMPTVDAPSVEAFHERFVAQHLPVRIRGAIDHWPALQRWSPEAFAGQHGGFATFAYAMEKGRITLDRALGFRLVHLTLGDYVRRLAQSSDAPSVYLRAPLSRLPPELTADLEIPAYCRGRPALRHNLWFSGADTVSQLHFDLPHNLVAQVYGQKRFILFAPSESRHVYPESLFSSTPHLARVDPESPDYARFPRLEAARGYVCTLSPGDLLFIPSRYWHHARSITTSITTNFWWATPALYPLVRLSDLYKRARGLNI